MLTYFWTGWKKIEVDASYTPQILDICRSQSLAYDKFTATDEGSVSFRMKTATAKMLLMYAEGFGISVRVADEGGFPRIMGRLFRRPGLCVGMLLSVVLLVLSTTVVWDVRVSGNATLSDRSVKEILSSCGFGVGRSLIGFRADQTENAVLMADKRLAWVSINMRGTVAYVEVREMSTPPVQDTNTPANLVAKIGGEIVRVELTRGNVLVAAGQWVGEGDLLVSGLYDSQQVGIRYTHAEAKVYARTMRQFAIEIPLAHEEKQYAPPSEAILVEKSLIFFGKSIKFSNKTRNDGEFYDIMKRVYVPFSDMGVGFPVSWHTTWQLPYTTSVQTYTYAEAEELAYLELARQMRELQSGAEIVQKNITTTRTPTSFLLMCELACIEDIAKEQTFEVEMDDK